LIHDLAAARRQSAGPRSNLASVSDEQLIQHATDGTREAALSELVRRYAPRLRRLLYTLVRQNLVMIEEAEQEVFATVFARLDAFQGRSRFSTFFYSVARNRVIDLLRSRRRILRRIEPSLDPDTRPATSCGPESTLLRTDRVAALRRAMAILPNDDRMTLYLKDGEDEPVDSLANTFGLPAGTVKSRLSRSRRKVARRMKEMGYE
jgi:RNA polymerase sigma-70 factor (ECF subfamily)